MDQENVPLQGGVMKPMKFSEAILEGFKMVGGKQCKGVFYKGHPMNPSAVCVLGARNLCLTGNARRDPFLSGLFITQMVSFVVAWGIHPSDLNDEGMPWEHIYGMARAAGQ